MNNDERECVAAEVERLRTDQLDLMAAAGQARSDYHRAMNYLLKVIAERDTLVVEVERLKAANADLRDRGIEAYRAGYTNGAAQARQDAEAVTS